MAKRAGAKVVPVALNEEDWSIPRDALVDAFSERTKLILINTPHNPTGKVKCSHCSLPYFVLGLNCLCNLLGSRSDLIDLVWWASCQLPYPKHCLWAWKI